jgi:hypothetical protein
MARTIRSEAIGVAALLAASVSGLGAQNPAAGVAILLGDAMTETTRQYGGIISWGWTEGTASQQAQLRVTAGVVECSGIHQGESITQSLQGQGKLDIRLGLSGGQYEIWAACPAGSTGGFHEMESYQQPGGVVELDRRNNRAVLPEVLKGSWTGEFGDGTGTMSWDLCLQCIPPPAAP